MECKVCGFDGKCLLVEVSYVFDGLLDNFGCVVTEGTAIQSFTTVKCPDCLTVIPKLTGVIDEEAYH